MPPRPRPRKISSAVAKDAPAASKTNGQDSAAAKDAPMPPPPDPLPPQGILEPEMNALSTCLKNAVVKTGQVYGFYADTRKLGIQKYAPKPPRSLTSSLGREIEKYDQLCDAMESQMLRAIAVLQRDLHREETRIKDAEAASVATRTRSKSLSGSPSASRIPLPPVSGSSMGPPSDAPPSSDAADSSGQPLARTQTSPTLSDSSSRGRRPSSISLSSLNRPAFPLKLDLSSTALRLTADEASIYTNGIASPVTLAPKSARPTNDNEIPDLMAAFSSSSDPANRPVDIDLTLPENDDAAVMDMDVDAGTSAEKPIELDLEGMEIDMASIFGDTGGDSSSNDGNAGLFSPPPEGKEIKEENINMEILDALSNAEGEEDLFASLERPASSGNPPETQPTEGANNGPSPGSILSNFAAENPPPENTDAPGQFDLENIDFSSFSGLFAEGQTSDMNSMDMDMENLLNMNGESGQDSAAPLNAPDGKADGS
ncbi:hypothetical protein PLICRDRAFT_43918 [Plicaturopsis crispa FD-325 SS-3]|nr:hypothetical protein PLICRDRAFT_43918 [Plicaturopsis crispa FD-325 SS-3]